MECLLSKTNECGIPDEMLKKDGLLIKYFIYPIEKQILCAIKQNPKAYIHVKKQTELNSLAAVKGDGLLLKYVKNPNNNIYIAAINQNSTALQFIRYQSDSLIELAVKKSPQCVIHIHRPSKELYYKLAEVNLKSVEYMDKEYLDDEFIMKIWAKYLEKDGLLLKNCIHQTVELCMIAIDQNPHALQYVNTGIFSSSINKELQKYALRMNGFTIKHIKNPSYELCKLAIAQNTDVVKNLIQYRYILDDTVYFKYHKPVENCNICYSSENHFMMFGCNHMFCRDCGVKINMCPLCRRKLRNFELVKVSFE